MAPQGGDRDPVDDVDVGSAASWQSPDRFRARNMRYRMSVELAALDTDFLVLTDAGEHAFRFNGRAMADDDTIRIEDMQGLVLYEAPAHAARKKARIVVVDGNGTEIGSVLRNPVSPLRDRFAIEIQERPTLAVDGNVSTHEYSIVGPPGLVADVSQKWFRARGSYGVEIVPGQQDALLLITVVVIEQMIHGNS